MEITIRKTLIAIAILIIAVVNPVFAAEMTVSVDQRCVQPSADISIPVTLSGVPSGLSGMNVTFALSDPDVAQITDLTAPSWASLTKISDLPAQQVFIMAVDAQRQVNVNDQNVPIGTIKIHGRKNGPVTLKIISTRIDDDKGYPVIIAEKNQQLCFGNPSDTIPATIAPADSNAAKARTTLYAPLPGMIPLLACLLAGVFIHNLMKSGKT